MAAVMAAPITEAEVVVIIDLDMSRLPNQSPKPITVSSDRSFRAKAVPLRLQAPPRVGGGLAFHVRRYEPHHKQTKGKI